MHTRIKALRKALNLTQAEFGERIGSTQNNIANYELGRRKPSAAALNNICKTFNVNETWLRTGSGEMFVKQNRLEELSTAIDRIMSGEHSDFRQRLVIVLSTLSEQQWGFLEEKLTEILDVRNTEPHYPKTIDEKVAEYRRQLEDEEKAAAKLRVSGSRNSGGGSNTNLA